jgi:hypothetical protein
LWFPAVGIAVEVDGRQHFKEGMYGKSAATQQARDRQIDALCQQHRLRLLRLHHADDKQWVRLLQWAVRQVQQNPHCWFVQYTASHAYDGAVA